MLLSRVTAKVVFFSSISPIYPDGELRAVASEYLTNLRSNYMSLGIIGRIIYKIVINMDTLFVFKFYFIFIIIEIKKLDCGGSK